MAGKDHQRFLLARYLRRLDHVLGNFCACRRMMAGRRTFNQSIADLRTGLRPRARRAKRARLDPEVEFLFAWKLKEQGIDEPEPAQIMSIARELARTLKPRRGRPEDRVLKHHVEGLVLLIDETCGSSVRQSQTVDSVYGPALKGNVGKALLKFIRSVDARVTETAVANIIRAMPEPGSPARKRFCDYFPFADYGGGVLAEMPGHEVKEVGVIWPIYCS